VKKPTGTGDWATYVASLSYVENVHLESSLGVHGPVAPYSTSPRLVQRDADSSERALPDIVKYSFLIIPGRFRPESTLMSVGDPQLSNQIQVTEAQFSR
jgi:hypothetical protein